MENYSNEFVLDLHDAGYWLARWHEELYPIGRDKEAAKKVIGLLNKSHRPSLEFDGLSLFASWNSHEKGDKCRYELLVENAI